jgi:hypothetical protein
VKIYAVLAWIGALFAAIAGLYMFGIGGMMGGAMMGTDMMGGLGGGAFLAVVGVFMLLVAVFEAFVGYGLWTHKPWARIAALVMSVINLVSFPIGTIIGAVGIWLFGFEPSVKGLFK